MFRKLYSWVIYIVLLLIFVIGMMFITNGVGDAFELSGTAVYFYKVGCAKMDACSFSLGMLVCTFSFIGMALMSYPKFSNRK